MIVPPYSREGNEREKNSDLLLRYLKSPLQPPLKAAYHHFPRLVLVFVHSGPAVKYVDADTLTKQRRNINIGIANIFIKHLGQ